MLTVSGLGLYHVAAMIAGLPALLLACVAAHFLVPYYSRLRRDGGRADAIAAFLQSHRLGVIAAWAMTCGLLAFGPELVGFLYRGPYLEIIELLPILVWINWFQMLQTLGNAWGLANGKPAFSAAANIGKLSALAGFGWLGWRLAGMSGLLLGFLASELIRYAMTNALLFRRMPAVWVEHFVATLVLLAAFLAFRSLNVQAAGSALALQKGVAGLAAFGVLAAASYVLNLPARWRSDESRMAHEAV